MKFPRFHGNGYSAMRRRIIAETEFAIALGLRYPGRVPRIPTIEVGTGTFSPAFASRFWAATLDMDVTQLDGASRPVEVACRH